MKNHYTCVRLLGTLLYSGLINAEKNFEVKGPRSLPVMLSPWWSGDFNMHEGHRLTELTYS